MSVRAPRWLALLALASAAACGGDTPLPTGPDNLVITGAASGELKVGDIVQLNVNGVDGCDNAVMHPARVVAIGAKALVVNDTLNPKNGFTTADFERFAARFDTLVYPLDVAAFGAPTDIDKNGHVVIVFTRAVNELTARNAGTYVGGFQFSRDLFPHVTTARTDACAASNQGEYFYLLAPDPQGTINGNVRTAAFVEQATTSVLAHEFQHLINASRRLYVNNADDFEDKWLDEGLSHVAEELLFYHESRLSPRRNLASATVFSAPVAQAYAQDMRSNGTRYRNYLAAPQRNSPYASDDSLATRGAAWSLLRYTADRLLGSPTIPTTQNISTSGSITVAAGSAAGDYTLVLVNTSRVQSVTATDTISAAGVGAASSASLIPVEGSSLSRLVQQAAAEPQPDLAFEAGLRTRERALAPRIAAARRWYREQAAPAPALSSRHIASLTADEEAENAIWFGLVNRNAKGIANLETTIGSRGTFASFVRDWSVSNATDEVLPAGSTLTQPSWSWRDIYVTDLRLPYPLATAALPNGPSPVSVVAGGAAYYRFSVPANGTASVRLSAGNSAAPFELVVVRTR